MGRRPLELQQFQLSVTKHRLRLFQLGIRLPLLLQDAHQLRCLQTQLTVVPMLGLLAGSSALLLQVGQLTLELLDCQRQLLPLQLPALLLLQL